MKDMMINRVIATAANESGIRFDEEFKVENIKESEGLYEMTLETEWQRIECYADASTGEVLGIMSTPKGLDDLFVV